MLETALECDSSAYNNGAVLIQKHAHSWHPVQFASLTLNSGEQNYTQIEREALNILFGFERLRQFLLRSKFIIKNDHKSFQKVIGGKSGVLLNCSAQLRR